MEQKQIVTDVLRYESVQELPEEKQVLVEKAYEFAKHAHAPYSNYRVGCAILLEDGSIVGGSNQENASFPAGICAERTALSACVSTHPEKAPVKMAVVVNDSDFKLERPTAPCGICRQTIQEVETKHQQPIEILFPGENGSFYEVKSIQSLLPLSFEAKNLTNGEN